MDLHHQLRGHVLDEFGFDLKLERQRREDEKENKDDEIFSPVNVPFNSPDNQTTPGGAGRKGGQTPQSGDSPETQGSE